MTATAGECSKCDDSCNTCAGTTANDCESCFDHKSISYSGGKGACVECHVTCKTCKDGSSNADKCTSCYDNALIIAGSFSGTCDCIAGFERKTTSIDPAQSCVLKTAKCPVGEYLEGTRCQICHSSCLTCNGPERNQCTACDIKKNRTLEKYTTSALYGECKC
jgi:proprotein convertase subtilisin/kexin type 5